MNDLDFLALQLADELKELVSAGLEASARKELLGKLAVIQCRLEAGDLVPFRKLADNDPRPTLPEFSEEERKALDLQVAGDLAMRERAESRKQALSAVLDDALMSLAETQRPTKAISQELRNRFCLKVLPAILSEATFPDSVAERTVAEKALNTRLKRLRDRGGFSQPVSRTAKRKRAQS